MVVDVLIITSYSGIILYLYIHWKKIQHNKKSERKVPLLCVAISITFVLFTSPFVVQRLSNRNSSDWGDFFLLCNSFINSCVYFFNQKVLLICKRKMKNYPSNITGAQPGISSDRASWPVKNELSSVVSIITILSTFPSMNNINCSNLLEIERLTEI